MKELASVPRVSEIATTTVSVPRVVSAVPNHNSSDDTPVSNNTRGRDSRRPSYLQHYVNAVIDETTGKSCEYRHLITGTVNGHSKEAWQASFANELGRLANGVGKRMDTGTNTIKFIPRSALPTGTKATYGRIVVSVRPQKSEPLRTRLTVGGNLINYTDDKSTPTADLITAKILFNDVISTPGAKFTSIDIKDFYLNTTMPKHEYMQLPIAIIPPEIIQQYNLKDIATSTGTVYIEICKGMYGLPQAGKLANDQLQAHLAKYGYRQTAHTPGLWRHESRATKFSLVVDDFGVLYTNDDDLQHLQNALREKYNITDRQRRRIIHWVDIKMGLQQYET